MAALESIVSRNLQCPVCLELLSDPRQLSCTHTFCKKCLKDFIICSAHKSITCPICRDNTIVKDGDVENLKTILLIKSLVDDLKNSKQVCDMCDTESRATRFCFECGKNMCDTCLEKHNNWSPNLKHRLVSVEDIREGRVALEKTVYCQEHPSKSIKRICTDVCITCKKFICERCRLIDHKDHIVQDAEEYKASTKKHIETLRASGNTKSTILKNHQTCIGAQKNRVTAHLDGQKAEINKIYQESLKEINERKAVLDKQIETQKEQLCKRFGKMNNADERLVASIESASELAGNSLKAPLDDDTIAIHDSLSDDLSNVLDQKDPQNKLAIDVADRAEQLIFIPNNVSDQLDIGEVQFVKCELEREIALPKKDSMIYIAAFWSNGIAVGSRFKGDGTWLFENDGKLVGNMHEDDDIRSAVYLSDERYAVLNDSNTLTVQVQMHDDGGGDDDTHFQESAQRFKTLSRDEGGPASMCLMNINGVESIVVGYRRAKKIQLLAPNGKIIFEFHCHGYEPQQITVCNQTVIITDDSTVRLVDDPDEIHCSVQKSGLSPFAAVAKGKLILIAWVKHNDGLVSIDVYTNTLKYIKTIISNQKIEKPERCWYYLREFKSGEIAFCTPNKLYIFKLAITDP